MLALAALQLFVLTQVPASGAAPAPPLAEGGPAATGEAPAAPERRGLALPSLLTAEPLDGTSMAEAEAGWSRLSLAYAQGVTSTVDLGAFASVDYATTELRAGALYRGPLPPVPPFDTALRVSLAWYDDAGSHWVYRKNRVDQGLELGLGASFSQRGLGGVVALLVDAPVTFTFRRGGGLILAPRIGAAYVAPLYGPITVGLRIAMGGRFGVGSSTFKEGLGELTFLAVAGYRFF